MTDKLEGMVEAGKEARDFLAKEYEREGMDYIADCLRGEAMLTPFENRAIRAITAALQSIGIEALVRDAERYQVAANVEAQFAEAAYAESTDLLAHIAKQDAEIVALRVALGWIANVKAMDYEYQRKAIDALAQVKEME